jgi:thiamine pyrophosphokinase
MPAEESHKTIPSAAAEDFYLRAVIFANGVLEGQQAAAEMLQPDDLIIAADGGANHCRALGVNPAVLIGDLDSVTEEELIHWREVGTEIIQHNSDKDENDLELALLYAKENGVGEVLILGGLGDRWDQTIANLLLPVYEKMRGLSVSFWDQGQWLYLIEGERVIHGHTGQTLSLIPIGGDVEGVSTQGLKWSLNGETLYFGATRGVSNLIVADRAVISVRKGLLLCIVSDMD